MTEPYEELLEIAGRLERMAERGNSKSVTEPLDALEAAATEVAKAWSSSWIGYHANVYYFNLEPPPPGAHFSAEWGIDEAVDMGPRGNWREYDANQLEAAIRESAGNPNLDSVRDLAEEAKTAFESEKSEILSILATALSEHSDTFLDRVKEDVENLSVLSRAAVVRGLRPSGGYSSRDSLAMHQGL